MSLKEEKAELIVRYENGELKDAGVCDSYGLERLVIIEIVHGVEDRVFGYKQFMDKEKRYFLVRVNYEKNGNAYIKVDTIKFYIKDFIKVGI